MFSFKLVLFFSPCSYDQSCFLKSVSFCTAVCLIFQCYCYKPYFITFLISGSVSPYHPISKKIFFALDYLLAFGKIFFLSMPHTHLMPYTFQVFHSTSMKLGMKYFNWCNNIGQKITVTSSARSLLHMLKWPRKKYHALLSYQLTDPTEATFKGGILPFGKNFNFSLHEH